jgi:NCS2 family nucleobase:cation symporter-2
VGVRPTGRLRLYGALIGLVSGYLLSIVTGILGHDQWRHIVEAPAFALPHFEGMFQFSFQWSMAPLFIIVSLCGALKTYGNLILCEKINDDDWKQSDPARIQGGLMADGLCVVASGLLGGMASDTAASNVALSSATGATSRRIGFGAGFLFILLGFSPKLSGILSIMPRPVMGAILIYVTCFMIFSGLSIIMASKLDPRKTFSIGIALIFGLSVDFLPTLYANFPKVLQPIFSSSLVLATVLAILLNQSLSWATRTGTRQ